jgi:hypothetical protein
MVPHSRDKTEYRSAAEVRHLYGLDGANPIRAEEIVVQVFQTFNKSPTEVILKEEFVTLLEAGGDLPDSEFDGHHGDEEWEVGYLGRGGVIVV